MTTYYVDSNSTAATLPSTLSSGDEVLFKTGARIAIPSLPASLINASNILLGEYGTGPKPILDGGVDRSDFVLHSGSIWKRTYASNVVGCVTEDNRFMRHVQWPGSVPALAAGAFTFDPTGLVLYLRPSVGVPADHSYRVSESLYGLRSVNTLANLTLRNLRFEMISVHGVMQNNRRKGRTSGLEFAGIGGAYIGTWLGNGLELGPGTYDWRCDDTVADDIYDSAVTSQTYGTGYRFLGGHEWTNVVARRCGLDAVEIAVISANQHVRDVDAAHVVAEDIGINCFSGVRAGYGTVWSTFNKSGSGTATIDGCRGRDMTYARVQRVWTSGATSGVNSLQDVTGTGVIDYIASSNRTINFGAGQRDVWSNVRDDLGRTPSNDAGSTGQNGSANGKFAMTKSFKWPTAAFL